MTFMRLLSTLMMVVILICFSTSARAQQAGLDRRTLERGAVYEPYFAEAGSRHHVNARLLWVIAYLETRFNSRLVSPAGARGLMQLMPATARRFGVTDPHNPVEAIDAAARYVRYLMTRFGGKIDLVLAAYNAGEETVEAYRTGRSIQIGDKVINPKGRITGGVPPYRETRGYVERGLEILNRRASQSIASQTARAEGERKRADSYSQKSERMSYIYHQTKNLSEPGAPTFSQSAKPTVRLSIRYDDR
ncbi:MAG: lytic transglycosylase domain-containing protein [Blastocatellales bacterium]